MSALDLNPTATLGNLPHADGSASYSWQGYEVVGTANGPIEAQRRDELPEEAALEVNIRPANGSGGPYERHLERLVYLTLKPLILTEQFPRCLIQVTLQILKAPEAFSASSPADTQAYSVIPPLPHLVHTAVLALLAGNIPLNGVCLAANLAIPSRADSDRDSMDGERSRPVIMFPDLERTQPSWSIHTFIFTSSGRLLSVESQGQFMIEEWEYAAAEAKKVCLGPKGLEGWLRSTVQKAWETSNRWRAQELSSTSTAD